MKPFPYLTIQDKARILFRWFPETMQDFINFLVGYIDSQLSYKTQLPGSPASRTIVLQELQQPPEELQTLLQKQYKVLMALPHHAAKHLFDDKNANYVIDCLQQYVTIRKAGKCFTAVVQLFFML